ncbi:MAG: YbhB/YbcL family Raf kinase inhibitor-like protein [Bacteroidetes bacterium]|nr:MAG: YbhB/YbcL family Raf kinase inhibitor-like protein [Bacteroidota bacterium]
MFVAACKDDSGPTPEPGVTSNFKFSTPAFDDGDTIPVKYSCDGANVNPKLVWSGAPDSTKSIAIIIDDPDAVPVAGYVWNHWLLCNILPSNTSIKEGASTLDIGVMSGVIIKNSFGLLGYGGPCPPPDQDHTYEFKIYALDIKVLPNIAAGSNKAQFEAAIATHLLDKASFTGTFSH